jgi:hypothetical protein
VNGGLLQSGSVHGQPRTWLRLEGLAVLSVAVAAYAHLGYGWLLFALLFLVPDVSFLGFVAGSRVGAAVYNTFHSYTLPLLLALTLLLAGEALQLPLIWVAHIGFDRLLGYGLKYPTAFQDTHLGRIGRRGSDVPA